MPQFICGIFTAFRGLCAEKYNMYVRIVAEYITKTCSIWLIIGKFYIDKQIIAGYNIKRCFNMRHYVLEVLYGT